MAADIDMESFSSYVHDLLMVWNSWREAVDRDSFAFGIGNELMIELMIELMS
jgi:hypothetical protein